MVAIRLSYGYAVPLRWEIPRGASVQGVITMPVKLTVNLSDEVADTLKKLAQQNGITITEQLRRAISTERWVEDIDKDQSKKLLIEDDGQLKEVVFR
jgi:Ribbon-helix-helix protein, copG family